MNTLCILTTDLDVRLLVSKIDNAVFDAYRHPLNKLDSICFK